MLVFDWRLGLLSLVPVALGFVIMSAMTGRRMADKMRQYGNALESMSNEVSAEPAVLYHHHAGDLLTLTRIMYMSENELVVADALARVDSVLDAEPVPENDHPRHPKDAAVSLKDVHFSYDGKTDVIKGVSLKIQPGQMVAFVGPSGGGKSTLANLICRFFDVQSGSVRVGGADVRDIPKEELMDTISFVFQNSRLLKGSILDNVKLGRAQATEAEVLAALKAAQCMDIVEKFPEGIHAVIGTKRRVSFWRRAAAHCHCPCYAEKCAHPAS